MTEDIEFKDWTEIDHKSAVENKKMAWGYIGAWIVAVLILWSINIMGSLLNSWIAPHFRGIAEGFTFYLLPVFFLMGFYDYFSNPGFYVTINPYRYDKIIREIDDILGSEKYDFEMNIKKGIINSRIIYNLHYYDLKIKVYEEYSEVNLFLLSPHSAKTEPVKEGRLSITGLNKNNWDHAKMLQKLIDDRLRPLKLI